MTFQKKAAPAQSANVARMVSIGQPAAPVAENLNYLDRNIPEVKNPLNVNAQVTEGNPDPATLKASVGAVEVAATPESQQNAGQTQADDDIDDPRFKGKSAKEIYQAYRNVESEVGKHRQEVGELRKTFDILVQRSAQPPAPQPAPTPVVDEEDEAKLLNTMLTKPKEFVKKVREQAVMEVVKMSQTAQMNAVRNQAAATLNDPNFRQWLEQVPMSLRVEADSDPVKFDFILRSYSQGRNAPPAPSTPAPTQPAPSHQRNVQVGVAASTGPVGKAPAEKTWTRREIQSLIVNDEPTYRRMEQEIARAYREGRVDLTK